MVTLALKAARAIRRNSDWLHRLLRAFRVYWRWRSRRRRQRVLWRTGSAEVRLQADLGIAPRRVDRLDWMLDLARRW